MRLLAAIKGSNGEVDVVRLGVVANGVAVWNERPETHHAVCVRRHLKEPGRGGRGRKRQIHSLIRLQGWVTVLFIVPSQ